MFYISGSIIHMNKKPKPSLKLDPLLPVRESQGKEVKSQNKNTVKQNSEPRSPELPRIPETKSNEYFAEASSDVTSKKDVKPIELKTLVDLNEHVKKIIFKWLNPLKEYNPSPENEPPPPPSPLPSTDISVMPPIVPPLPPSDDTNVSKVKVLDSDLVTPESTKTTALDGNIVFNINPTETNELDAELVIPKPTDSTELDAEIVIPKLTDSTELDAELVTPKPTETTTVLYAEIVITKPTNSTVLDATLVPPKPTETTTVLDAEIVIPKPTETTTALEAILVTPKPTESNILDADIVITKPNEPTILEAILVLPKPVETPNVLDADIVIPKPNEPTELDAEIVIPKPDETTTVLDAEIVPPTPTETKTVLDAEIVPPKPTEITTVLDADIVIPKPTEITTFLDADIVIPKPNETTVLDADIVIPKPDETTTVLDATLVLPTPTETTTVLDADIVTPKPTETTTVLDSEIVIPKPTEITTVLDAEIVIPKPTETTTVLNAEIVIPKPDETTTVLDATLVLPKPTETTTVLDATLVLPKPVETKTVLDAEIVTPKPVETTTVFDAEIVIPKPVEATLLDADIVTPKPVETTTVLDAEIVISKPNEITTPTSTLIILDGELVSSNNVIIPKLVDGDITDKIRQIVKAMIDLCILQPKLQNTSNGGTVVKGGSLENISAEKESWIQQLVNTVNSLIVKRKPVNEYEIVLFILTSKTDSLTSNTDSLTCKTDSLTSDTDSLTSKTDSLTESFYQLFTKNIFESTPPVNSIQPKPQTHSLARLYAAFSSAISRKTTTSITNSIVNQSQSTTPDEEAKSLIDDINHVVKAAPSNSTATSKDNTKRIAEEMITLLASIGKDDENQLTPTEFKEAGEQIIRELLRNTLNKILGRMIQSIKKTQQEIFVSYLKHIGINVKSISETSGGGKIPNQTSGKMTEDITTHVSKYKTDPLYYNPKYKAYNVFMDYPDIVNGVTKDINNPNAVLPIFQETKTMMDSYIFNDANINTYYSEASFTIPPKTETKTLFSRVSGKEDNSGQFAKFDAIVDNQIIPTSSKTSVNVGTSLSKTFLSENRGVRFDKFFTILNTNLAIQKATENAKKDPKKIQDRIRKELWNQFTLDLTSIEKQQSDCTSSEICNYILLRRLKPYLFLKKKLDEKKEELNDELKELNKPGSATYKPLKAITYIDYIDGATAFSDQVQLYIRPYTYRIVMENKDRTEFILTETNVINDTTDFRNGTQVSHILFVKTNDKANLNANTLEISFLFDNASGNKSYGVGDNIVKDVDYAGLSEYSVPAMVVIPPFINGDSEGNQERLALIQQNNTRLSIDDLAEIGNAYSNPSTTPGFVIKTIADMEKLYKADLLAFEELCKRSSLEIERFKLYIADFIRKYLDIAPNKIEPKVDIEPKVVSPVLISSKPPPKPPSTSPTISPTITTLDAELVYLKPK